jgi:hypothetical protein
MRTGFKHALAATACLGTFALAAPLQAAAYLKLGDIKGESTESHEVTHVVQQRAGRDSGDAHLDYLTITLTNATVSSDVGPIRWMAPESLADPQSRGEEHSGRSTGVRQHARIAAPGGDEEGTAQGTRARELDKASPQMSRGAGDLNKASPMIARSSRPIDATSGMPTGKRDAASGMATGKRQHRPLSALKPLDKSSPLMVPNDDGPGYFSVGQALPGCAVGTTYDHALVGEDGGKEIRLDGVEVDSCAAEEVSFYYNKITWEY